MSLEQLVGLVDYGQHVPEEPTTPGDPDAPVPSTDVATLTPEEAAALAGTDGEVDNNGFTVRLTNFTGPFDLLLQLIGKHKLDVTEVALHQVTDDFIAYIRAMGDDWDLGEASEFLLIAATLLDLKAARLLPAAEVEDEEDLALLEARDLLFARLLQYKAYKEAAAHISELEGVGTRRWPRQVSLEARYAEALPELVLGVNPARLLKLAIKQFVPKPGPPQVSIAHIHQVRVSVREHAALITERLSRAGAATFSLLVADCENTLEIVARFLALLELYREGLVDFEQPVSLDELTIRWIGGEKVDVDLDIDDYEGTPPEIDTAAADLPTGTIIDGEIVEDDDDLGDADLETRALRRDGLAGDVPEADGLGAADVSGTVVEDGAELGTSVGTDTEHEEDRS
ncbi:segregation and condensation protein A [Actinoplanes sp. NPDC051494]|uniref:segregation and condensation protein A n=1 Tax=Actinoplanes sp. NPDC051494 TaxID=3363907 RepID=UPI003787B148